MASLRIAAFALALLGCSMLVGQASAAMPVNGLTEASQQINSVDKVWYGRWRGRGWGYRGWGYRRWYGGGARRIRGTNLRPASKTRSQQQTQQK